jgi:ABC-type lipoprotein release transport system permease subunit
MRLILALSLRNLLRQKRRNLFLGIAICFGMMILVLAISFSHGLTDTLLNRVVVYIAGHMSVVMMEDSNKDRRIIRDKERIATIVKSNVKDIKKIWESIGVFARVIGNSRADNAIIVGRLPDKDFLEYLGQNLLEGNLGDFTSGAIENPVILYSNKAKTLGVKYRDTINARFSTVTRQQQSTRLYVAAVLRSSNLFEEMAMFVNLKDLKSLLGLKSHETGALYISFKRINNPDHAIKEAVRLHKLLKPGVAVIYGEAVNKNRSANATALGYLGDKESLSLMGKNAILLSGATPAEKSENGALISKNLAADCKLKTGDSFTYRYKNKYENLTTENRYKVAGIFNSAGISDRNVILLNERSFYKTYLPNLPADARRYKEAYVPDRKSKLYPAYAPEWKLLPRTSTFDALKLKMRDMTKTKWKGPWLDVRTMYESADFILKLENALNLVALVAVLILFFIILIGVLNTLRMTIRERTREIGTLRAIGMQRSEVKYMFISETVLLTAIACVAGIVLSFIVMWVIGLFTIQTDSVLSILLVNRRLHFLPTAVSIVGNYILIILMAAATAYFPARKASNLSAVVALGHFE